jgi:hypothetical protein
MLIQLTHYVWFGNFNVPVLGGIPPGILSGLLFHSDNLHSDWEFKRVLLAKLMVKSYLEHLIYFLVGSLGILLEAALKQIRKSALTIDCSNDPDRLANELIDWSDWYTVRPLCIHRCCT